MAGLAHVELTADCAACGLEGGVVETYDALVPACRFGLPATTRCKLCAAESKGTFDRTPSKPLREIPANRCPACLHELLPSAVDERSCPSCAARAGLEESRPPATLATLADLERALDSWTERESFPSRDALVRATFVEPDVTRIFEALRRGERIEVVADPFANMGMRTTGGSAQQRGDAPAGASARSTGGRVEIHVPAPASPSLRSSGPGVAVSQGRHAAAPNPLAVTLPDPAWAPTEPLAPPLAPPLAQPLAPSHPPPRSAPPRAIVYPLVSVIVADGEVHPEELALVDRFLQGEGLAPLAPHELCVHHPSEVAHFVPGERREDVVKLMCESAAVDGMPDESERRVIRAYATAWDVDDEKLDFWMWGYETMNTSLARQLFLKLRRFVLSARWGEGEGRG